MTVFQFLVVAGTFNFFSKKGLDMYTGSIEMNVFIVRSKNYPTAVAGCFSLSHALQLCTAGITSNQFLHILPGLRTGRPP